MFPAYIGGKSVWHKIIMDSDGIHLYKMEDSDFQRYWEKHNKEFMAQTVYALNRKNFEERFVTKNTSLDKEAEEAIMKTSADSAMCDLF